MPTTDERREVAARLRNTLLTEGASQYMMEHDCDEPYAVAEVVFRNLRHLLGFDNTYSVYDVAYRLADLIEPEPERTCQIVSEEEIEIPDQDPWYGMLGTGVTRYKLSCGHETLGLSYENPKRCSECGARVKED